MPPTTAPGTLAPTLGFEELQMLEVVDTPTVCNVIELFKHRPDNTGYMDGRIQCCFPKFKPMVGYAVTATFRADAPPRGGNVYASVAQHLEAFNNVPGRPIAVFQDLDDPTVAATFGEVMCTAYKAFGATGIVTSGGGRDLDQVEAIGFPAFVGSTICSHGYCHVPDVGVPVNVGGITIYPGDLLHGDRNGVTTIPLDIAGPVARACKPFMDLETEILTYLRSGSVTVDGYKKVLDGFKKQVDELKRKLTAQAGK